MSMAMHTNDSWEWAGASPRISFSHDFSLPDGDPSPADAIFSDGKLLPLPPIAPNTTHPHPRPSSLPPTTTTIPSPPTTILYSEKHQHQQQQQQQPPIRPAGKKAATAAAAAAPFWRFGRSSSVSCCHARPSSSSGSFCPFPLIRSKSTGSALGPGNSIAASKNRGLYCNYAGGGGSLKRPLSYNKSNNHANINNNGGIRISPILNEPAGSAAATTTTGVSIFNYLLCSCGNRSMRRELALQCTP
ncbi:uncharacterized protein LOC109716529 [Ananas comosus]|uniref:Uncharacterized protein LOC109716529 n=1 Tax=Ananas comosus TaxID=4615 RepID=A0A6P5FPN5_ANACO|nr:uncharacterized protein LOC109716529 [Ananas comosus]